MKLMPTISKALVRTKEVINELNVYNSVFQLGELRVSQSGKISSTRSRRVDVTAASSERRGRSTAVENRGEQPPRII